MLELEVEIPPLPEQKAIAHVLGSLDDKIELNRQMNATLEAMAQALFKSWFVDFDPVIDNALAAGNPIPDELQARAAARESLGDARKPLPENLQNLFPASFTQTEELGWIPEGWEVARFESVCDAKQGRYLPSKEMTEGRSGNNIIPVWGGNGVRGYTNRCMYEDNVVVLTCRGSNCGLIEMTNSPSWVSNISFACLPKIGSVNFLHCAFLSVDFSDTISGSAQPQITYAGIKDKILGFPISSRIVGMASAILDDLYSKRSSNIYQTETLAKTRDTLLPKLLSGELRLPIEELEVAV